MPANLNALIRYKTINSCLYGGRRRWTIDELREKCSEALAECRGRYTPVSERTIRDDIRVMRSDILGFNAPIKQEGGLYFYSDPGYSIMNLRITDSGLAEQVLGLLMKLREKVNHPEMEIIVEKLCRLLDREYEPVAEKTSRVIIHKNAILTEDLPELSMDVDFDLNIPSKRAPGLASRSSKFRTRMYELLWGDVLGAIVRGN
jgi:predicted DNA-binding transcriptional regulator YafY